jgi:DNA-binding response OmpR family regulator
MDYSNFSVLLIDDEEDLRLICAEFMRSVGFNVDEASRGDEALELINEKYYNAVISDSFMPGLSGIELLDKLNEQSLLSKDKGTLFYLCTGSLETSESDVKEKGGTGLVVKPFDIEELVETVQSGIEKKFAS